MTYTLAKEGVFYTIQGEGALLGTPMVFIRLAGCSIGCAQCDTDYRVHSRRTVTEIVDAVRTLAPSGWVWLTGGEPTDRELQPLVDALNAAGYRVALATAGQGRIPLHVAWLSVSPHTTYTRQQAGEEVKVVPGLNGLSWDAVEAIGQWAFSHRFIQPLHDQSNLVACIDFVKLHPAWRLSPQAHKVWGIS